MNILPDKRISTLKRQTIFGGVVAIVLFIAGCFGFYLGWHQIKRPVFIIFGFANFAETPRQADEISSSQLFDLARALKRNEYISVDPAEITKFSKIPQQGRHFILTFDNFSSQTASISETLFNSYGIKPVVFLNQTNLQDTDEVKKSIASGFFFSGYHEDVFQSSLAGAPLNASLKPFIILKQSTADAPAPRQNELENIFVVNDPREVVPGSDTNVLPRLKYVKGSAEAGMPDIKDWIPPSSSRKGTLTVTLSILLHFICFSWALKSWLALQSLKKLQRAGEKAE